MVALMPLHSMVPPMLKPMPLRIWAWGTPASISLSAVPTMAPSMAPVLRQMFTESPTWSPWSWVTSTMSTGPRLSAFTPEAGVKKGSITTCACGALILKAEWPYQVISLIVLPRNIMRQPSAPESAPSPVDRKSARWSEEADPPGFADVGKNQGKRA